MKVFTNIRLLIFLILLGFILNIQAQTINTWSAGANGDWNVDGNWSLGHFPTVDETAIINTAVEVIIPNDFHANCASVQLSNGGDLRIESTGRLTITVDSDSGNQNSVSIDDGRLTNIGTLTVNGNGANGANGIRMRLSAEFLNTGNVILTNLKASGILMTNGTGTLNNSGFIDISNSFLFGIEIKQSGAIINNNSGGIIQINNFGVSPSTTGDGIFYNNPGTFNNNVGAILNISTSNTGSGDGIDGHAGGIFNNSGTVYISDITGSAGHLIEGPLTFTNQSTGKFLGEIASATSRGRIETDPFNVEAGSTLGIGVSGIAKLVFDKDDEDLSNTIIEMEINNTGTAGVDFDQIVMIDGIITITDAILNLYFCSVPNIGDKFKIIDANSILGSFGTINVLPNNGTMVTFDGATGEIEVTAVGTFVTPTVTISNNSPSEAENSASPLQFQFNRNIDGCTLPVNFNISGTIADEDFCVITGGENQVTYDEATNTGTISFLAGNTAIFLNIMPKLDCLSESNETVIVTLSSGSNYNLGTPTNTSGTITNVNLSLPNPMISINEASGDTNNDGNICLEESATLDAGSFNGYLWSTSATTQMISVTMTGNYSVVVTDANGCTGEDAQMVTATVPPSPNIAVDETSGSTDDDGNICMGESAILDAGSFDSYLWSTGETSQMISVTMTGNYSVVVTDANGCTGEDAQMVTATVPPSPNIAVDETSGSTDDDGNICMGESATLDAGSFDNYLWSTGETSQMISVTMTGNYMVIVTNANGCTGEDMQMVTATAPSPTIIIDEDSGSTDDDGNICMGESAILDAGSFDSYLWSTGETSQMISVTMTGNYMVIVTNANGCTGEDAQMVTATVPPSPNIAVDETSGSTDDDGNICLGESATLDAGSFDSYLWSTGETSQMISVTMTGNYMVTVTNANGCTGEDMQMVTATAPSPTIIIDEDSGSTDDDGNICMGESAILDAGSFDSYLWSTGATSQMISVTMTGNYSVVVTDGNGCTAEDMQMVTATTLPVPNIEISEMSGGTDDDGNICLGESATLNAGSFSSYLWSTGATSQMISVTMTGNYSVVVTDGNGCTAEDMQMVTTTIPSVSLAINSSNSVSETGGTLTYRFTRADCTQGNLTVNFSLSGSAANSDFTVDDNPANISYNEGMQTGTVQFSGTDTTIDLEININGDSTVEENETIIVKIEPAP